MAWIKQNYDRFLLAVFALVLLVSAGLLITSARGYNDVYAGLQKRPVPSTDTGISVDAKKIADDLKSLTTPELWQPRALGKYQLPLFVSVPYVAKDENGTKRKVAILDETSEPLHPPIPNEWFLDHGLDLLAPNALEQDPDGDGFSNLDEWNAKTDPTSKDSHPPYWTKLYFKRLFRQPFHLRFDARNGDTYIVNNTDDDEAPSQFVKMNQTVKLGKYRFKVIKFEEKYDTAQGFKKDVSELTLSNMDTGQTVVLPKQEEVDSPTTYAVLSYVWNGPGARPEFGVQRDGEFTLAPENNVKYKVLELGENEVRVLKTDENKELHVRMQTAAQPGTRP